jgi:hypothetical protein
MFLVDLIDGPLNGRRVEVPQLTLEIAISFFDIVEGIHTSGAHHYQLDSLWESYRYVKSTS